MAAGKVMREGAPADLIAALAPETVELDCSVDEEARLLDGVNPSIRRLRVGQRLMLYLDDSTAVIEHIRRDHGERGPIVVRPTNLEDVFLSLTVTHPGGNA
jgi:hypothetical protein